MGGPIGEKKFQLAWQAIEVEETSHLFRSLAGGAWLGRSAFGQGGAVLSELWGGAVFVPFVLFVAVLVVVIAVVARNRK